MTAIRVRAQEPADIDAIAAIFSCPGVFGGTLQLPFRSIDEVRETFGQRAPGTYRLVAEHDGRVVGLLGLHVERGPRRAHCGAFGMAVHDDFQGRGVGGALMAAMIELADNWLGLHRVELQVYTDNAAAVHLYEKFGFVIEGTLRDYAFRNGRYVDAYAMARIRPVGASPAMPGSVTGSE